MIEPLRQLGTTRFGILYQALVTIHIDGSICGRTRNWMCVAGQTTPERFIVEPFGQRLTNGHSAHRGIPTRQPFGHSDHIRNDIPMVDSEP